MISDSAVEEYFFLIPRIINCSLLLLLSVFVFLQTSERTLDAPDILDDYYLNLLDWGSSNVLSIALGSTVYLWDATDGATSELVTVDEENGPVTSVKWAPDGSHVAVGLNNSDVQLWDSTSNRLVCSLFQQLNFRDTAAYSSNLCIKPFVPVSRCSCCS